MRGELWFYKEYDQSLTLFLTFIWKDGGEGEALLGLEKKTRNHNL